MRQFVTYSMLCALMVAVLGCQNQDHRYPNNRRKSMPRKYSVRTEQVAPARHCRTCHQL